MYNTFYNESQFPQFNDWFHSVLYELVGTKICTSRRLFANERLKRQRERELKKIITSNYQKNNNLTTDKPKRSLRELFQISSPKIFTTTKTLNINTRLY